MIIYYAIWDKFQVILKIKISIKPWYFLVRASLVFLGALLNLVKLLSTQTGSSARVRPPRLTLTRITNNNNGKCSPPHHRKRHATLSAERHCLHFQSLLLHLSTKAFGSDARCAIPQRQHFIPDWGSQPLILHFYKNPQLSICHPPWKHNSRHWRSSILNSISWSSTAVLRLVQQVWLHCMFASSKCSTCPLNNCSTSTSSVIVWCLVWPGVLEDEQQVGFQLDPNCEAAFLESNWAPRESSLWKNICNAKSQALRSSSAQLLMLNTIFLPTDFGACFVFNSWLWRS